MTCCDFYVSAWFHHTKSRHGVVSEVEIINWLCYVGIVMQTCEYESTFECGNIMW